MLDTGATSRFVKTEELPKRMRGMMQPLNDDLNLKDGSEKLVHVCGTCKLIAKLETSIEKIRFYVVDNFRTAVFLGCDFCDSCVNAARPWLKTIRMDDVATVFIVWRPLKISTTLAPPSSSSSKSRKTILRLMLKATHAPSYIPCCKLEYR